MLINREEYSSTIKDFRVYGAVNFPKDDWVPLGEFEAENTKGW